MSSFSIRISPLLLEVSVDCQHIKNRVCCVEHKINPDLTSISVTSHHSRKVQWLLALNTEGVY